MTAQQSLWRTVSETERVIEGARLRDEGMLRVQAQSVVWRTVAYEVLVELARQREFLTADDLAEEMDRRGHVRPKDGRAAGPVMQKAIRAGVLIPHDFVTGRNPLHHADVCRRYRSGLR